MPRHESPADLTPEERTRRVAALLATGLLRLGSALSPQVHGPQKFAESTPNELATSPDKSVTGHAG